jgi:glutathione S-transferase
MKLFDSAFSPFARKVRMVLEHKGLQFEVVDGLLKSSHAALQAVNGRVEVPVLADDGITIVNSADIIAYLEFRYPEKPVYPSDPAARVQARAWERTADTLIDAVLVNLSYWKLLDRHDTIPAGLLEKARADMGPAYAALERDLTGKEFVCGALSIADIALFPHIASGRFMEVEFDKETHPNLARWLATMRRLPICIDDQGRARNYVAAIKEHDLERKRIFWRGDRIEWMLSRGFHDWFFKEIAEGRVLWPGPAVPSGR